MKKLILLSALVAAATTTDAKVTLPKIFSDNMVMQQNTKANLGVMPTPTVRLRLLPHGTKRPLRLKPTATENGKQPSTLLLPEAPIPYLSMTAKRLSLRIF